MDISVLQGKIPDITYNQLQQVIDTFDINTESRLANFLGQCNHESEGFTHTVENLNYSAQALEVTFPKHFNNDPVLYAKYARNPEMIANRVYANRMGNGDESTGDGWLHRGRGNMQITGANNQKTFFKAIGLDENSDPELISSTYPLVSAAWFWKQSGLNEIADKGTDVATETIITRHINGGTLGLQDRIQATNFYYSLLTNPAI